MVGVKNYGFQLIDLTIACDCGKLITETNKYGMFCEDFCGLEEAKKADKQLIKLLKGLDKLINAKIL
jgi:hypothetical protein